MQRKGGRAPAGHLSRLKPVEHDPLAEYGLPSKGEKRLLSPKVQEAYYAKITERYLAFCTAAGDRDELQRQFARLAITDQRNPKPSSASVPPLLPPPQTSQPSPPLPADDKLSQIFSALRKLREALVASRRQDDFSNQVYLFSIRLGILASSYETYYPSLLYLLRRQPPNPRSRRPGTSPAPPSLPPPQQSQSQPQPHTPHLTTAPQPRAVPLTTVEQADLAAYLILDTACRRGDLAGAYAQRAAHGLRDRHVDAVLRALAADNWAAWRRARRQADLYRATLMEGAERRVRAHALRAIGRAYLTVGVRWVEGQLGMAWDGLREGFGVGWEVEEGGAADGEEEGGKVVVRRVKGK